MARTAAKAAPRTVGRSEIAGLLGVTERSVTDWVKQAPASAPGPFPSRVRGRSRTFPPKECVRWLVEFRVAEALARRSDDAPTSADARKKLADAELAEIKVAQAKRHLVNPEEAEVEFTRFCDSLRAVVQGLRSRYAGRVLNLTTHAQANSALDGVARDLLEDLRRTVEETAEAEAIADGADAA